MKEDNPLSCPIVEGVKVLSGKWKPMIVHLLMERPFRFGEIRRRIPLVSQKVLTQQLKELELDGVVSRAELRINNALEVTYSLSPSGLKLHPVLVEIERWVVNSRV